jgi:hypothetical protein
VGLLLLQPGRTGSWPTCAARRGELQPAQVSAAAGDGAHGAHVP